MNWFKQGRAAHAVLLILAIFLLGSRLGIKIKQAANKRKEKTGRTG